MSLVKAFFDRYSCKMHVRCQHPALFVEKRETRGLKFLHPVAQMPYFGGNI